MKKIMLFIIVLVFLLISSATAQNNSEIVDDAYFYEEHLKLAKEMSINLMVLLFLDEDQTDRVRGALIEYQTELLKTLKEVREEIDFNESNEYSEKINRADEQALVKIERVIEKNQMDEWNSKKEGWWKLFKSKAFKIRPNQKEFVENE